jgi:metal-responsive CopG/Arc/MetJ family transcriptional regulator
MIDSLLYMRKVVSVRLREDVLRDIDNYTKKLGLNSRTEFIKQALIFYIKRKAKGNL